MNERRVCARPCLWSMPSRRRNARPCSSRLLMTRNELEHAIRAACDLAGDDEAYVFGSQALLAQSPDAPDSLRQSAEADIMPKNGPGAVDAIDGALGESRHFTPPTTEPANARRGACRMLCRRLWGMLAGGAEGWVPQILQRQRRRDSANSRLRSPEPKGAGSSPSPALLAIGLVNQCPRVRAEAV
jgi:hypothetical protein